MLGVTQAAVSLYLRSPQRSSELLERLGMTEEQGSLYADLLAEDLKKSPIYAVNTLYSLWSDALGRGSLCAPHRRDHPSLAQCEMCINLFGPSKRAGNEGEVEKVASAVRVLEGSSMFVRLMPEVSVNIAYAPQGATSISEVVAVPGRIVKVNGLPRSFMRPDYGASTHVASILLSVVARHPDLRSAMNLKYDERVGRIIRRWKLKVLRVSGGPQLIEELRRSLLTSPAPIDALIDPGAQGSEPGLYLFSRDPLTLAEMAMRLARSYVTTT